MKYLKWVNKHCHSLENKNIIVTGANSGIGFEATKYFAYLGANVIMACRSIDRASKAKEEILLELPNAKLDIIQYDQSSLESINAFIKKYYEKYSSLYALVNNAGIFHPVNNSLAENGLPLTIMTNFLGAYYLTTKMLDFIKKQDECKIIFISSVAANFSKIRNYEYLTKSLKNTSIEYNISKCACAKAALYLSTNLSEYNNIKVLMAHPGISATNIFSSKGNSASRFFKKLASKLLPIFVHSPAKACLGMVYAAANDNFISGTYLGPRGPLHLCGFPKIEKPSKFIRENIDEFMYNVDIVIKSLEDEYARSK